MEHRHDEARHAETSGDPSSAIDRALTEVGPRLRRLRADHGITLGALAEATGISKSTLSRLESGQRRPSLELLLPLAQVYQVPLDEMVGAPEVGDPRVRLTPRDGGDRTVIPLTKHPGPLQAWKTILPGNARREPNPVTHEGYEWLYVLSGRLRLIVGDHDLELAPGEAAEFDTRLPHWFGPANAGPVELLSLFGRQGERVHLRAAPRSRRPGAGAD